MRLPTPEPPPMSSPRPSILLRPATPADIPLILELIRGLAEY